MKTARFLLSAVLGTLFISVGRAQEQELPLVPCTEGPDPMRLEFGERTQGCAIDFVGDVDRIEFNAEEGDEVWILLSSTGNGLDPVLTVTSPSGVDLPSSSCVGGCSLLNTPPIEETGTYTIQVRDNFIDEGGAYDLQIERRFPAPAVQGIPYGASVAASIDSRVDVDIFSFDALSATTVRIIVAALGTGLDPVLTIRDPNGETIPGTSCVGGCSLSVDFSPSSAGTYTCAVRDNFLDEGGNYSIRLECISGDCPRLVDVAFEPVSETCVDVVLSHDLGITGGELGIAYDSSVIASLTAEAGSGLPAGATVAFESGLPLTGCPPIGGVNRGLAVSWVNSQMGTNPSFPAIRRVIRLCAELQPGATQCSSLRLVECIGEPGALVRNIVTDQLGQSHAILSSEVGQICPPPAGSPRFRRGDVNGDGIFDVSDAISSVLCQFRSIGCPSCDDILDANNDGAVDVSDSVYLIAWRFGNGSPPPAPFPACGLDTVAAPDTLPGICSQTLCP
jgi:hypothetical protein